MEPSLDEARTVPLAAPIELARREKIINNFARVTQFLTWPFLYVIGLAFFDLRIHGRENFRDLKSPFIIISNHISFYDSFLFRLVLGAWTPHLPLRFMAVHRFEWKFLNFMSSIGVIDFVYSLFGVFVIVPGRGIHPNLVEAREIIDSGGNVVIYPEGKIFTQEGVGPFKKGAAVLMLHTRVPVIPVSFRPDGGRLRRKIIINVGQPIKLLPGNNIQEMTESFQRTVTDLYDSSVK